MSFNKMTEKKPEVNVDYSEFKLDRPSYLKNGHLSGTVIDYKIINELTSIVGNKDFEDAVDEILQMSTVYLFDTGEVKYLVEIIEVLLQMLKERGLDSYNNKFVLVHLICCTIDWSASRCYVRTIGRKIEFEHCLDFLKSHMTVKVEPEEIYYRELDDEYEAIEFEEFVNDARYYADYHNRGNDKIHIIQIEYYLSKILASIRKELEQSNSYSYCNKFLLVQLLDCAVDWGTIQDYIGTTGPRNLLEDCLDELYALL